MPEPRPAFVLHRGEYDAPREPVDRDTPAVLPPFPPDAPRDRLGLARWLTHPDHPLTARVAVNRYLADVLRPRAGGDDGKLRHARGACRRTPNCSTGWRAISSPPAGT